MSEDLTTRDVFQQLDTRVGRVESDLRDFRSEVSSSFVARGEPPKTSGLRHSSLPKISSRWLVSRDQIGKGVLLSCPPT